MGGETDWRPAGAPAGRIDLGEIVIRRYATEDAPLLHDAVTASIEHLRPWMPWIAAEPLSVRDRERMIRDWSTAWDERRDFTVGIFSGDTVVGSSGLHLRGDAGVVEIGYWVRAGCTAQGIATRTVRALADAAFALGGVTAVEIHHDAANAASARVAEKAGFVHLRDYPRDRTAPGDCGTGRVWVSARER